jgi:hypothetical protein
VHGATAPMMRITVVTMAQERKVIIVWKEFEFFIDRL